MSYTLISLDNIAELETRRGNSSNVILASILGLNYPVDEAYSIYRWTDSATDIPDGIEIVAPNVGPSNGRWFKIDLDAMPQVNTDWNSTSGPSELLNKPNLAAVSISGSYTDLINRPIIPAAQVNTDWAASTGLAAILNKPALSAVALTGNYNDLGNRPLLSAVATTGAYGDLSGRPSLALVATTGSYLDLSNTPTIPAAQVQIDWNLTTGIGSILNKPILSAVSISGSYLDLSNRPTLSAVATSGAYADLSGRPTIYAFAGTSLQYTKGDGTYATFPTTLSSFTNNVGYITGITSANVIAALGFTPYNSTNPSGYLSSITNVQVTTALGFTPVSNNRVITINGASLDLSVDRSWTVGDILSSGTYSNPSWITSLAYAKLTGAPIVKRVETYSGVTDASGNYTVTYPTAFPAIPDVQPQLQSGTASQVARLISSTTTGFTVNVTNRASVTVLTVEVLLAATTPVVAAPVSVLVTAR